MRELPYTSRDEFQLKNFYIPEMPIFNKKSKIRKKPMPAIAIRFNGACNQASGQSIAISWAKSTGFRRPGRKRKGSLSEFGRNR